MALLSALETVAGEMTGGDGIGGERMIGGLMVSREQSGMESCLELSHSPPRWKINRLGYSFTLRRIRRPSVY